MPARIEDTEQDLQNRLNLMTKKIELLDNIRTRPHHQATRQDMDTLHLYQKNYDALVEFQTDGNIIALMLEAKAEKRAKKDNSAPYQPFLLNTTDKLAQWMLYALIKKKMSAHELFRYDIVLRSHKGHCSSARIDFDGISLNVVYIDAAGDENVLAQNLNYIEQTIGDEQNKEEHLHLFLPQIQYDKTSCAIFSIQHLNRLSHLSVEKLTSESLKQDGALMKNIQSLRSFNFFPTELRAQFIDKKQHATLEQHIENYSIKFDATDSETATIRNYAIDYKHHKYLVAAHEKLKELLMRGNGELVDSVIKQRSSIPITEEETDTLAIRAFRSHPSEHDPDLIKMKININDIKKHFVDYFMNRNKPIFLLQLLELTTAQEERLKLLKHTREWLKNIEPYTEHHATLHKKICQELGIFEYLIASDPPSVYFKDESTHDIAVRIKLVHEFIQQGGDINQPGGQYNMSPLILALSTQSSVDILTCLLESGARVDINYADGITPIDIVLVTTQHDQERREQLILLLLQHGAIASKENLKTLKQTLSEENYQKYEQEIRPTDADKESADFSTQRKSF